jgi:hypothetical protein
LTPTAGRRNFNAMKPLARGSGLILRSVGDELVVYDTERHEAHCLDQSAAAVFRACNGRRNLRELTALLGQELPHAADASWVRLALGQLERARLLETPLRGPVPARRDVLHRLGRAAVLPVVVSIVSPTPAMAATCRPNDSACSVSSQCCSGCCRAQQTGPPLCKPGAGQCIPG